MFKRTNSYSGIILRLLYSFIGVIIGITAFMLYSTPTYKWLVDRAFDFTVDFYGMQYSGNTANFIDAQILYFGAYEKPMLYFLRDAVKHTKSQDGIFVDVGANVGEYSLFMSKYVKAVDAFEPYEPVRSRFLQTVTKNKIDNISIHGVGLGDKNEELPFNAPLPENLGTGSFIASPQNKPFDKLPIIRGDDFFLKEKIKIAAVKIDVEGYEKHVLLGLANTIRIWRPIIIVEITYNPGDPHSFQDHDELVRAFPEKYKFLKFYNYYPFDNENGKYRLTGFKLVKGRANVFNILAYPEEKISFNPNENTIKFLAPDDDL